MCDDFESDSLQWQDETVGTSSVTRDAGFGRTGGSLHVIGATGSDTAALFRDPFPATPPARQHVRVYLFTPATSNLNVEPVTISNADRNNEVVFSLYGDSIDIHGHGIAGNFSVPGSVVPVRDRWVCYELAVTIAADGAVELFVDGVLAVSQTAIDTRPAAGELARLHIGMPSKPANETEQLWIDDVVADLAPIGCQ